MLVGIKIIPKKEVLDVQGRAIADILSKKKYPVQSCSYGKFLKLNLNTDDSKKALQLAHEMAQSILCHSLVESYELEILSE